MIKGSKVSISQATVNVTLQGWGTRRPGTTEKVGNFPGHVAFAVAETEHCRENSTDIRMAQCIARASVHACTCVTLCGHPPLDAENEWFVSCLHSSSIIGCWGWMVHVYICIHLRMLRIAGSHPASKSAIGCWGRLDVIRPRMIFLKSISYIICVTYQSSTYILSLMWKIIRDNFHRKCKKII